MIGKSQNGIKNFEKIFTEFKENSIHRVSNGIVWTEMLGSTLSAERSKKWLFSLFWFCANSANDWTRMRPLVVMGATRCRLRRQINTLNFGWLFKTHINIWQFWIYLNFWCFIRRFLNFYLSKNLTWTVTIEISSRSTWSISTTSECLAHFTSRPFTLVMTSPSLSPALLAFPSAKIIFFYNKWIFHTTKSDSSLS